MVQADGKTGRKAGVLSAGIALVALCLAPAAKAAYDPLGGGTTKLILAKRFARFLHRDRVKLIPRRGASRRGRVFQLPVSGGFFDPTKGKGAADSDGVLVFKNQRRRVPLRKITVKAKRAPLVAKVGGSQLKVATSAGRRFRRRGFAGVFVAKKLRLTYKAITRLNKKLRPRAPFRTGQVVGTLVSRSVPRVTSILAAGRATIVFDPGFLAKLDSRFVSLNPIFPAEHVGGTFTFPIVAGGRLAPDASEGELRSGGEVELLQLGAGQVFWKELWLDLGAHSDTAEVDVEPTPAFPGKLGRIGVFDFSLGSVSPDPGARTVSAGGALALGAQTAATMNEAFAQNEPPVFAAGEPVGTVSFTGQGQ